MMESVLRNLERGDKEYLGNVAGGDVDGWVICEPSTKAGMISKPKLGQEYFATALA